MTSITTQIIIVFASMSFASTALSSLEPDVSVRSSEVHAEVLCAKRFIKAHVPCQDLIIWMGDTENVESLIKEVGEDICNSMKVRNFDTMSYRVNVKQQSYVITAKNVEEFAYGMLNVTDDASWNPVAKFIIRVRDPATVAQMRKLFFTLMQHKMYHVAFITTVNNETGVYTYYPFKDGGCGRGFSNIAKISDCTIESISNISIFTLPDNPLNGCTIQIIATEAIPGFIVDFRNFSRSGRRILGMEQLFIETVAKLENLNLAYSYAASGTYGVVLSNGSATGMLNRLQNGSADVAMGGFLLMENRAKMFEYVWGFKFVVLNLYFKSRGVQRWQHVYRGFSREVWAMILLVFLGVSVTLFYITRVSLGSVKRYELPNFMLTLWGYLFLNTSSKLGSDKPIRLFVLSWILFSYFVSNFYSTALYSLITGRPRDDNYVDLNIIKSGSLRPCISNTTHAFLYYSYNQTLTTDQEPRPECQESLSCLRTVATEGNSYAIENEYTYAMKECEFIDNDGRKMLNHLQFIPYVITVVYFNKGLPLRKKFDKVAMMLLESGLMNKQFDDISLETRRGCHRKILVFHKVQLGDMRVPFFILFGGTAISFMVFGLELLYKWCIHYNAIFIRNRAYTTN